MKKLSLLLFLCIFSTECSERFQALCRREVAKCKFTRLAIGELPDGTYVAIYGKKKTKNLVYRVKMGTDRALQNVVLYGFVKKYDATQEDALSLPENEQRSNVVLRLAVDGVEKFLCISPPEFPQIGTFAGYAVPVYHGRKELISKKLLVQFTKPVN